MIKRSASAFSLGVLLALSVPVFAAGPTVSNCTLRWDPVTKNTDGTPVTDLKEYRIYVSTSPGGQNLSAPQGPPIIPPAVSTTCAAQGITTRGQKYAVVTAVDDADRQSGKSNEVPFVFDGDALEAPANLTVVGTQP